MESNILLKTCDLAYNNIETNGGPFGCIITDSSFNEISNGNNMVTKLNDPTAHAEIVAIRKACQKLNTFDLSNVKLFSSCEPCPMCLSAIYWSKIKQVYYANTRKDARDAGFDDDFIYEELNKDMNDRKVKLNKLNISNSLDHFKKWIDKKDKILY